MRVVVTGGTGLLGSHLVTQLLQKGGYDIVVPTRGARSTDKLSEVLAREGLSVDGVSVSECDFGDFEQVCALVEGADIVFHTAAIVSFERGTDMVATNVELAHYVVEACLRCQKRPLLVHTSSIAALGTVPYPALTDEKTPFENLAQASPYSQSKFLSENEVWRGAGLGLDVVMVNPSVIVGRGASGSEGLQPIFRKARGGVPFYTTGVMGFVDVRDVARAMVLLSGKPESWGKHYVLSGANLSYRELITILNNCYGHRPPRFNVPHWLMAIAAKAHIIVTPDMMGFLYGQSAYDGQLICRTVDFKYTPIEESIKEICR